MLFLVVNLLLTLVCLILGFESSGSFKTERRRWHKSSEYSPSVITSLCSWHCNCAHPLHSIVVELENVRLMPLLLVPLISADHGDEMRVYNNSVSNA